jgi:prophage antirepressor-like protein
MEEITDPNCIVKAFQNNNIAILKDESNKYFFRGNDVAKVLEITNIRSSIQNFTEKEKGVRKVDTLGGPQDIIFLSSHGVYRLLYSSKKKQAEKFREWVGDILDDIIFNESNELKRQLEEHKLELEEKNNIITNNEYVKKVEKHNFLICKFRNKKCVYIAEIEENLIKIGSTKDISERYNGLARTFGKCIFLDIFEHIDYQAVESNILINVKKHLYKEPVNKHVSKEIVKLSDNFNYKQLHEVVLYYINTTDFLSPSDILEKQKLDNETQKLNIIQELLNNGESLQNILVLFSYNHQNTSIIKEKEEANKEIQQEEQPVHISKQILNSPVLFKGKKPKGQKIHKIDPNNLQNIIKTYDSMVYLLRSPECNGYNKSGILNAISNSRIYKEYRWNFINKDTMPTAEYKSSTPIREAILKLNETKDLIIETFTTKDEAAKNLGIGKLTMRNIIKNQEKYNNCYYIEYNKCPLHIIEKYDKPIFGINSVHAKRIKQINPITNTHVYFNNLNEIQLKFGICSKTIINSINDKTVYAGSLWEYDTSI